MNRVYTSIPTLLGDMEVHDQSSFEHMMRVGEHAREYAKIANMSIEDATILEAAARLHDIGKLYVPQKILCKCYSLEQAEFDLLKKHPGNGQTMLILQGTMLDRIRGIISTHHERWDGLGYPIGIAGSLIPVEARIIHVLDAFDAMTERRPYGTQRTEAEAKSIIRAEAGKQFDPRVVQMFLDGY